MALQADRKYDGQITSAAWVVSRNKGTNGLQVDVETPDGDYISHTFWITPRTRDRFAEDMAGFGIDAENLRNPSFLRHEMPTVLIGQEVSFTTKEETYNDKRSIKVAYLNPKTAPSDPRGIEFAVASLFAPTVAEGEIGDDDVPF